MKRIIKALSILIFVITLSGCFSNMGPKETVSDFLKQYVELDKDIIKELDKYLEKQDITSEQKSRYKKVIKDEYSSISYKIKKENIKGNTAKVEVEITVKDLYSASKNAEQDLLDNPLDFYVDGSYSSKKFIDHKLDIMEHTTDVQTYTISIFLEKEDNKWKILELDNDTLEKIHGIYNYQ